MFVLVSGYSQLKTTSLSGTMLASPPPADSLTVKAASGRIYAGVLMADMQTPVPPGAGMSGGLLIQMWGTCKNPAERQEQEPINPRLWTLASQLQLVLLVKRLEAWKENICPPGSEACSQNVEVFTYRGSVEGATNRWWSSLRCCPNSQLSAK